MLFDDFDKIKSCITEIIKHHAHVADVRVEGVSNIFLSASVFGETFLENNGSSYIFQQHLYLSQVICIMLQDAMDMFVMIHSIAGIDF